MKSLGIRITRRVVRTILLLGIALGLGGCATTSTSSPNISDHLALQDAWSATVQFEGTPSDAWVITYNDPVLSQLVAEAFSKNPSLDAARARLNQSRASTRITRAALQPSLNFSSDVSSGGSEGDTSGSVSIGGSASWEADLWGRLRAAERGTALSADAVAEDLRGIRFALAASVAEAYFLAIEADLQSMEAARNFEALRDNLSFIEVQYERGLRSSQEIALIRADVASARARTTAADNAQVQSLRTLEALVGRYPSAELEVPDTLPAVPAKQYAGTPASMLLRRPDLRAARFRIDAISADIDEAVAARLPRLTLNGSMSVGGDGPSVLFRPESLIWNAAGSILAPLLDGGLRRAEVMRQEARLEESLALYRDAAIKAFGNVETLLDRQSALDSQIDDTASALSEARNALNFTRFRFENGDGNLFDVLSVQQRASSLERSLIGLQRERLVQHAQLALELGGSP
ncbi:MAG: efflux transporter outer membrane subunit [Pseudomonadota bacterium]